MILIERETGREAGDRDTGSKGDRDTGRQTDGRIGDGRQGDGRQAGRLGGDGATGRLVTEDT